MNIEDLTLDVEQHIEVRAPIEDVFKSVLNRLGKGFAKPDGEPVPSPGFAQAASSSSIFSASSTERRRTSERPTSP